MAAVLAPGSEQQLVDALRWAAASGQVLDITGDGSKHGFGHQQAGATTLRMSAFRGVRQYDPAELVMVAGAGTPLAEVETLLADNGQQLAFEPPRLGVLFGAATTGTIGGAFLANLHGPRRFLAGAARDHLLGVRAVSGRGESWKAGGRVIKNVTGYDLCKLIAGSWGTLAAVHEVAFKVVPAPAVAHTLVIAVPGAATGLGLLRKLAALPVEASGLAYVPGHTRLYPLSAAGAAGTCLVRLEGSAVGVGERSSQIMTCCTDLPAPICWTDEISADAWRQLRDGAPVQASDVVVLLSVPPAQATLAAAEIDQVPGTTWYADGVGGKFWIGLASGTAAATIKGLRALFPPHRGSVVVLRAEEDLKSQLGVLSPQTPALQQLTRRLQDAFDPARILGPGRLYPP